MKDNDASPASEAAAPGQDQPPPPAALMQMMYAFAISQALYVATELGIADLLKQGSRSAADLAGATGTHTQSLFRLLRSLTSLGVLAMDEEERFGLTPVSELLVDQPGSMRSVVRHMIEPPTWKAWGALLHSVKTGETAFDHANGQPIFEFYAANPGSGAVFHDAMTGHSEMMQEAMVGACDFSSASTVVDVGGGNGGLLLAILKANEELRGIVFDQPDTVAATRRQIDEHGLAARCEALGGDFFQSVPTGDTYVLKYILHDWTDEQCLSILRNIAKAATDDARVVIFDGVIQSGSQPGPVSLGDVHMMVMTGGRERTETEFRALLGAAQWKLTRIQALDEELSILEAVRA
jgi:hypothetical protein